MMSTTRDETIELILDHLFTNGDKVKGSRLLLITEDYSGAARVSNARYLGGYSRPALRGMLQDALREGEPSEPKKLKRAKPLSEERRKRIQQRM